ncbi:hypothetical protein BCON_0313g00090 [Botryotinia convoluta]|uniref:Uncharacterized protein n=1 Tax=Botryotinia convoluta TaxID=54673 RepID=A0A4Z1HE47_9HELO|nr:hypothetical protein BCON_0313g00090 [Botryotinia convoluta]
MGSADVLSRLSPVRKTMLGPHHHQIFSPSSRWTINSQLTTLYLSWLERVVLEPPIYDLYLAVQAFSIKKLSSLWFDDLLAHEGYSSQHDRSPVFPIIDLYIGVAVSADTGSGKGNQLVTTLAGRLKA